MIVLIYCTEKNNMHILVDNTKYDYNFCLYLSKVAGRRIIYLLNPAKTIMWDEYFENEFGKKVKTLSIIQNGASNIVVRRKDNNFLIEIDDTIYLNTFGTKLCTLCREINYGNINMKPYPIFTDVFNDISDHLEECYSRYLNGAVM